MKEIPKPKDYYSCIEYYHPFYDILYNIKCKVKLKYGCSKNSYTIGKLHLNFNTESIKIYYGKSKDMEIVSCDPYGDSWTSGIELDERAVIYNILLDELQFLKCNEKRNLFSTRRKNKRNREYLMCSLKKYLSEQ